MYLFIMYQYGSTASLMVACQKGHYNIVQLLLDRGANIYAKNKVKYIF